MIKLLIAALCCGCFLLGCVDSKSVVNSGADEVPPHKDGIRWDVDTQKQRRLPQESLDVELTVYKRDNPLISGNPSVTLSYDNSYDNTPLKVGNILRVTVNLNHGDCEPTTDSMTVHLPEGIDLMGAEGGKRQRQYAIAVTADTDVHLRFKVLAHAKPLSERTNGRYQIEFRQLILEHIQPNIAVFGVRPKEHSLYAALNFESAR